MKKKNFSKSKVKKKYIFNKRVFNKLLRRQSLFNYKPLNIISFMKRFRNYDMRVGYKISCEFGLKPNMKLNFLDQRFNVGRPLRKIVFSKRLRAYYDFYKVKRFRLLKNLLTFKSFRLIYSFPVRGQRTKTNAKTRKKYSIL